MGRRQRPGQRDLEWHPLGKIWQTPGEGEEWFEEFDPSAVADFMAKAGLPMDSAKEVASQIDQRMGDCILRLYRSALEVGKQWQPDLGKIQAPGLVFWGEKDTACSVEFANELASDTKAKRVLKLNAGHWTIVERSVEVARALEHHWASVDSEAS